jgi:hypothetical protein
MSSVDGQNVQFFMSFLFDVACAYFPSTLVLVLNLAQTTIFEFFPTAVFAADEMDCRGCFL